MIFVLNTGSVLYNCWWFPRFLYFLLLFGYLLHVGICQIMNLFRKSWFLVRFNNLPFNLRYYLLLLLVLLILRIIFLNTNILKHLFGVLSLKILDGCLWFKIQFALLWWSMWFFKVFCLAPVITNSRFISLILVTCPGGWVTVLFCLSKSLLAFNLRLHDNIVDVVILNLTFITKSELIF